MFILNKRKYYDSESEDSDQDGGRCCGPTCPPQPDPALGLINYVALIPPPELTPTGQPYQTLGTLDVVPEGDIVVFDDLQQPDNGTDLPYGTVYDPINGWLFTFYFQVDNASLSNAGYEIEISARGQVNGLDVAPSDIIIGSIPQENVGWSATFYDGPVYEITFSLNSLIGIAEKPQLNYSIAPLLKLKDRPDCPKYEAFLGGNFKQTEPPIAKYEARSGQPTVPYQGQWLEHAPFGSPGECEDFLNPSGYHIYEYQQSGNNLELSDMQFQHYVNQAYWDSTETDGFTPTTLTLTISQKTVGGGINWTQSYFSEINSPPPVSILQTTTPAGFVYPFVSIGQTWPTTGPFPAYPKSPFFDSEDRTETTPGKPGEHLIRFKWTPATRQQATFIMEYKWSNGVRDIYHFTTLKVEKFPSIATTSRSGVKIASTGEDGTSVHETDVALVELDFDWVKDGADDATVDVAFGYSPVSLPFTFTVTPNGATYRISTTLNALGVYRGAVDVKHSANTLGYRHFFEITFNGVALQPYTFVQYQFIPRLAVHALGNVIDEYYQTFTLCLDQGWQTWTTWKGGRGEPPQVFTIYYFNGPLNPLPKIVLQNNPALSTGTFSVNASGTAWTTDIVQEGGEYVVNFKHPTLSDAALKQSLPAGFQAWALELTSQPARPITGVAEQHPEYYRFTQYRADFPAGVTIQYRTAKQVVVGHDTLLLTDPALFQQVSVPSAPLDTALCPNNSYYTTSIAVGPNAKIGSLCLLFQASLGLQLSPDPANPQNTRGAGSESRHKGSDINAVPFALLRIPETCIWVETSGNWRVRFGRIPGSALRVAGFTWWEIPPS